MYTKKYRYAKKSSNRFICVEKEKKMYIDKMPFFPASSYSTTITIFMHRDRLHFKDTFYFFFPKERYIDAYKAK